MDFNKVDSYIVSWLLDYLNKSSLNGFVVGVSGGVDSAVTSTLCAKTNKNTLVLNMPIFQHANQVDRSNEHIEWLNARFKNVSSLKVDLTSVFESFLKAIPVEYHDNLSLANLRSRIRMSTLYTFASNQKLLVAGTGNKVEDFGVGFFTKYGDGGVDLSPIADLMKTEVFGLAKHLGIVKSIITLAFSNACNEFNPGLIPEIFLFIFLFSVKDTSLKVLFFFIDLMSCWPILPMHPETAKLILFII